MLPPEEKKMLDTLADLVFPTGAYDYVDGTIEVRLYDEHKEYLSSIFERKWDERRKG